MQQEITVLIVGAGPAGLAISACLNLKNIPNIVLEREECCASLWKKRAYERLKLHLAKQFCELPHMSFPPDAPTFVSRKGFVDYLDEYVSKFDVSPLYNRTVECGTLDGNNNKWRVMARNTVLDRDEEYVSEFLVVATGENAEGFIPRVAGLDSFDGVVMHSLSYTNGKGVQGKKVLVVGSGNSGMEIAFDLTNWGAEASIVIRSLVHCLKDWMVKAGMMLLKYMSVDFVDDLVMTLSKWNFGDLEKYGIQRTIQGPFYLKKVKGRSPVIDCGTIEKIKSGEINVLPSIERVNVDKIQFSNGDTKSYDAIIFATGYKTTVRKWLKDDGGLFNEEGMPRKDIQNHWKGENGLYCAGFARAGLFGISNDAKAISEDIDAILSNRK